jgi:hypothetical protein
MTDMRRRPSTGKPLERIYAWITDDGTGEGILAIVQNGEWMPLISEDRERLERLREFATRTAKATGKTIRLKVFQIPMTIEEITPE